MDVVVAAIAVLVAVLTWKAQATHNKLSVRPLAAVLCSDLNGRIVVTLRNHGTGPLIIKKLRVHKGGVEVADNLYELCEDWLSFEWFVGSVDGRSIPVGGKITLLRYTDESLSDQEHLRGLLSELEVVLIYEDIYRDSQPRYGRRLDWFARRRHRKG